MIFITGDTHFDIDIKKIIDWKKGKYRNISKDDYLIVSGDFGLIWFTQKNDVEKRITNFWDHQEFTTLFIPGNHENYDRLLSDEFPEVEMFGNKVKQISKSIFMLNRGEVYTIENKKFFTMGGGYSIDKAFRTPHVSWWEQELPSTVEYLKALDNLKKVNNEVDFIISHSCSNITFEKFYREFWLLEKKEGEESLRAFFDQVEDIKFKKWYFGHFHIDKEIDEKHTALYQNIIQIV